MVILTIANDEFSNHSQSNYTEAQYLVKHKRRIYIYLDSCPPPDTTTAFHLLLRTASDLIRIKYSQLIHEEVCCHGKGVSKKHENFPPV